MSLVWQLATRFRRAKQANGFVSFISASSTFGIGLGCFVLILLLSVMNGFQRELEQRLLSFIPHGELYAVASQGIKEWPEAIERFRQHDGVDKIQPYAKLTGMLQKARQMKAIELTALEPELAADDALFNYIDDEVKQRYATDKDAVILGKGIAEHLELEIGDTIQLLIPTVTDDLTFVAPQTIWLTYVGNFSLGGELDNRIGFIPLQTAIEKLNITFGAQGLRFQLNKPFDARQVMREIGYSFEQAVFISDWTRTQGHLYQDIQLVRLIVYIALVLVIAVACFNIVSGLVMTVAEKKSSIGILMTMGLSANKVRMTFVLQGLLNGLIGVAVGTIAGVVTALNLTDWIAALERLFDTPLLSGDIYFVNFLPTELHWQDVFITAAIALLLSLISTVYPANKAAKLSPAQALS